MRRTSGSSPAAAATRSMPKPGIASSRCVTRAAEVSRPWRARARRPARPGPRARRRRPGAASLRPRRRRPRTRRRRRTRGGSRRSSAASAPWPESRRLFVRQSARLASTARPSAPPIMKAVLTTPEARPDSSGSTSLIAARSTGLNAMPAPKPSRIMLGSTSIANAPSTGAARQQESPAAANPSPAASGALIPNRITSLAERPTESTPMITFAGQEREPDLERAVAAGRAGGRGRRGRTTRTSRRPRGRRRRSRPRCCAAGRAASGTSGARHARLDPDEDRDQDDGGAEQAEGLAERQPVSLPFTIA